MYRHLRKVVSNYLTIIKREYNTSLNLDNKKKPKLLWKYLNALLLGKLKTNIKGVLVDGQIMTDAKCKANAFNKYFIYNGQ